MVLLIADRKDIDFVLHEQMKVGDLTKHEKFAGFNKKTVDIIVSEARKLAINEILPLQQLSDMGCVFDDGKVWVPEEYHPAYEAYKEGGWLAINDDLEWGGQEMPKLVSMAANEYFFGACNSFMLFPLLSHAAAKMIENFGTEKQKNRFLKKMYSGQWSGTMAITETQAGSDLGALATTAVRNPDGNYSISGNKIFISAGEHDLTNNIIHLVLARISGAPPGTKGLSLFLVPKFRINDDGSLGEFNDVVCTDIEEKTGLHGCPTCFLALGGKGECIGSLIGEENKGMAASSRMINEVRQGVGFQGFASATSSYIYTLNYASRRRQAKEPYAPQTSPPVPIIQHPDVRRQIMTMKAYVEGMRSLLYYTGLCYDKITTTDDPQEIETYKNFIELLTPIVKGYVTDKASEVCSHGIQVYGGYGYLKDFPVEQILRDCRAYMIYPETNGMESLDMVEHKLGMKNGKVFLNFIEEIKKTIAATKKISGLNNLAVDVETTLDRYKKIALALLKTTMSDNISNARLFSHPLLEVSGDLVMAWMLLWRAGISGPKLKKIVGSNDPETISAKVKKDKDAAFYEGQLKTAQFFINTILPVTMGKLNAIAATDGAAVNISRLSFGV